MDSRQDNFEESPDSGKRRRRVGMYGVSKGGWIACISAILLFAFMFLTWFDVKATNTSNLLFAIQSVEPGRNAWEALDFVPVVLAITILAALAVGTLRLVGSFEGPFAPADLIIVLLGLVSVLLILIRIVDPPIFQMERTVTYEGTVQPPVFLALGAAAGIAYGGWRSFRGKPPSGLE